jgi:hypothetical protein
MGRLAEFAGFGVMFWMVATLPLIGLVGLGWLGGAIRLSSHPPK